MCGFISIYSKLYFSRQPFFSKYGHNTIAIIVTLTPLMNHNFAPALISTNNIDKSGTKITVKIEENPSQFFFLYVIIF